MYRGRPVSVAMPAFDEAKAIEACVSDYLASPYVDEVIVGNNNSTDGTGDLAAAAGAKVVEVPRQGYGYACKAALDACAGDFLVLTESDGSLPAENLEKLLAYIDYFDIVKGARSNRFMVTDDADWTFAMMFANWVLAKYMQVLFLGTRMFEDVSMREVGGTQRVMRAETWREISPHVTEGKSAFLPDTVTIALKKRARILEVPIAYRGREGISKITGNRYVAAKLAFRMFVFITRNRFRSFD